MDHPQVDASYAERVAAAGLKAAQVPTPASLILNAYEVLPILSKAVTLEALGIDDGGDREAPLKGYYRRRCCNSRRKPRLSYDWRHQKHVPCQPTQEFHGRVADWIGDGAIGAGARRHRAVRVATHGRAERTTELLRDYEIRAARRRRRRTSAPAR